MTKKKTSDVLNAKKPASITFLNFELIKRFLLMPKITLMYIKKHPITPQTEPITKAEGISSKVFSWSCTFPNLSVADVESEKGEPKCNEVKIESVKVLMALHKNILQIIWKVQKVFGFEISYESIAPPIGAPNAALTPAEKPAAINYRFITSFYRLLKKSKGM